MNANEARNPRLWSEIRVPSRLFAVPHLNSYLETFAAKLKVKLPKNLGDLVYTFRYRKLLPASIIALAGEQEIWIIRPAGRGRYRFALIENRPIRPNEHMAVTKVPDATPGIVAKFGENGVTISSEKHYKLVSPKEVTDADLETYRGRLNPPA